ncbi:MAG: hypothetical protein B7Z55_16420 [Planctomycetales bacterium 12-60-4]|nr:MAG: hypothetical protein B7Z55_16420 [Planctomycetales bacterium 12-60-4]
MLVGADQALVSPVAGTTRDYLTATWNCGGLVVELIDTAGWEDGQSLLNQDMSHMRESQLRRADLVIWCSAADLTAAERLIDGKRLGEALAGGVPVLQLLTKCDVPTDAQSAGKLSLSAQDGQGLDDLYTRVQTILEERAASRGHWLGSTAARCQESLRSAASALAEAENAAISFAGDELIAAELRLALDHLGVIVGAVYTDDLLDRIFSKFCIGK